MLDASISQGCMQVGGAGGVPVQWGTGKESVKMMTEKDKRTFYYKS